jgi:SHS family lactate transporter-like MFS transporter
MSSAAATQSKPKLTKDQRNSFLAAELGWAMDAFDYFLAVLVYADIGKDSECRWSGWRS